MYNFIQKKFKGFTLIELISIIAVMAVLASVILVFLKPGQRIDEANDVKREAYARTLQMAFTEYVFDTAQVPAGTSTTPTPICAYGVTDPSCVNVDYLVDENYLTELERDVLETGVLTIGYTVKVDNDGFVEINSTYLGMGSGGVNSSSSSSAGTTVIAASEPLIHMQAVTGSSLPIVDMGLVAINGVNLTVSLATVSSTFATNVVSTSALIAGNYTVPTASLVPVSIDTNRSVPITVTAPGASSCTNNAPYNALGCNPAGFNFDTNQITSNGTFGITTPETGASNVLYTEKWILRQMSNINGDSISDWPLNFTVVNGVLYFTATDNGTGTKWVFKTDGTTIYKIYNMGAVPLAYNKLFAYNNEVYFHVWTGTNLTKLYKTNGTTVTQMTNFLPAEGTIIQGVYQNRLYFSSNPTVSTVYKQLYSTDGTTVVQHTNEPYGAGVNCTNNETNNTCFIYNNTFYMTRHATGTFSVRLHSFNGTHFTRISNLGASSDGFTYLGTVNTYAILKGQNASGQEKLYRFDGTSITQISDTYTGNHDVYNAFEYSIVFNNELYFYGKIAGGWNKILKTNGTTVTQVTNIRNGNHDYATLGLAFTGFSIYNNELYVWLTNGITSNNLHLHKIGADGSTVTKVDTQTGLYNRAYRPVELFGHLYRVINDGTNFNISILNGTDSYRRDTQIGFSNIRHPILYNGTYIVDIGGKVYAVEKP